MRVRFVILAVRVAVDCDDTGPRAHTQDAERATAAGPESELE